MRSPKTNSNPNEDDQTQPNPNEVVQTKSFKNESCQDMALAIQSQIQAGNQLTIHSIC